MTRPIISPFSKDYVSKIPVDYRDQKYKRPVINQPSEDIFQSLEPKSSVTLTERFTRLSKTKI